MYTKTIIHERIDALVSYCNAHKVANSRGYFWTYCQALKSAVTSYYETDTSGMQNAFAKMITQMDVDLIKRNTTWEHQFGSGLPTNYPYAYDDFAKIFNGGGTFDEIMNISDADFFNGFPLRESDLYYENNPIIATWIETMGSAHSGETSKIDAITDFCENGGWNDGLISCFENRGIPTITKSKQDLARLIYIQKNAKPIINAFGWDLWIPSYL